MSYQNFFYKKYKKYKYKYNKYKKMIGGTFKIPREIIMEELQPADVPRLSDEQFKQFEAIFDSYLISVNLYLLKDVISGDLFMNKYNEDGFLLSIGITHQTLQYLHLFYQINCKITDNFYVYRSINKNAIKNDILNNYLPFSTVYNIDYLTDGVSHFGGSWNNIVILKIFIPKESIYLFIGGSENEIVIQPCKLIINNQFIYTQNARNYIVYYCSFIPYSLSETLLLIDQNKR